MRTRAALVAALLLAALPPEALAAKQVCRIVQDARGDAEYPSNGVPGDDGDDLLSADLASDGVLLTAVWRLAALRQRNPSAPLGQDFVAYFKAPGTRAVLYVDATTAVTGPAFGYGYVESGTGSPRRHHLGRGKGALDTARREVRVTVPTRGFAAARARLARGARLSSILVQSSRLATTQSIDALAKDQERLTFDEADGRVYVVGTPSCARPLK